MEKFFSKVTKADSGLKLIQYLKIKFGESYSLKKIKKMIDQKICLVNGRIETFSTYIVGHGDEITLSKSFYENSQTKKETSETNSLFIKTNPSKTAFDQTRLLFEDEFILIYNKPPGVICDSNGITAIIQGYCSKAILVHRLDKETSGVLLFAKSPKVFDEFCTLFKNLGVYKSYFAIVKGVPKKESGSIKSYMGKIHGYQGQSIWASLGKEKEGKSNGLLAHTDWKLIKVNWAKKISLLQCWPKTGRTHQLRVHLSEMGHPILGDSQYDKERLSNQNASRVMLHAQGIEFKHPITGSIIKVEAPFPRDFIDRKINLGWT